MAKTLILPKELYFRSLCQAIADSGCTQSDIEAVDFSRASFVHPSGMVGLAALIASLKLKREIGWVNAESSRAFRYFQNMNFFREFGVFEDESFVRREENKAFARLTHVTWESNSSKIAKNLAKLVSSDARPVYNDFFTCLEESVRNVSDHARAPGYAMAQSAPAGGGDRVYRIAICDFGRGIKEGLADAPEYQNLDDKTALELACKKGVSGAIHRRSPSGDQINFGMGLFQIDRSAETTNGEFILSSGNVTRVRQGKKVTFYPISGWRGTCVEVQLYLSGLGNLESFPSKGGSLRFG
jgi:hypothetical protein